MWAWNITYTQENPYSDTPRTRLTPGAASREVTIGYVIWSSINVGLRPGHSVKTIACTSDRSGIASSGTSKTAHTPPAVSNSTPRITRTGLRALFSMSPVIIDHMPPPTTANWNFSEIGGRSGSVTLAVTTHVPPMPSRAFASYTPSLAWVAFTLDSIIPGIGIVYAKTTWAFVAP